MPEDTASRVGEIILLCEEMKIDERVANETWSYPRRRKVTFNLEPSYKPHSAKEICGVSKKFL